MFRHKWTPVCNGLHICVHQHIQKGVGVDKQWKLEKQVSYGPPMISHCISTMLNGFPTFTEAQSSVVVEQPHTYTYVYECSALTYHVGMCVGCESVDEPDDCHM